MVVMALRTLKKECAASHRMHTTVILRPQEQLHVKLNRPIVTISSVLGLLASKTGL